MEPNENQMSSYFHHPLHHHHHHQQPPPPPLSAAAASPTNGLLPSSGAGAAAGDGGAHTVYPRSAPSSAAAAVVTPSPLGPAKRKRGRPRKYGTPEQALAAKKAATASSHSAAKDKKDHAGGSSPSYSAGGSAKKSQLAALGNAGQGFTPHVISVSAGEDVVQKILMFMHQSKREICILSASGSISNVSLRQPAASGGSVSYEGQFSIISFSGSYIHTETGNRSGGLSVCLASTDGQIIGGGLAGPLKAAGPVEVIVGTFLIDTGKDVNAGVKSDGSAGMKFPSPVGVTSPSSVGFRSSVDSGVRNPVRLNDDQQSIGGGHFMAQPNRGIHMTPSRPTEWRPGPDARTAAGYDLTGRGLAAHQSPENGDYDQIPD